jgi:hypothetical protein
MSQYNTQIENALKPLMFDIVGSFNQDTFVKIGKTIDERNKALIKIIELCNKIKLDFYDRKADHSAYGLYAKFYEKSKLSFSEFKEQIIFHLKTDIENEMPEIYQKAKSEILKVELTKAEVDFKYGFKSILDIEKEQIVEHLIEKERTVQNIRIDISSKVIDSLQKKNVAKKPESKVVELSVHTQNEIINKIEKLIKKCDESEVVKKHQKQLADIKSSQSLSTDYFYKELHDEILKSEQVRKEKSRIRELLVEINNMDIHASLEAQKLTISKFCNDSLNAYNISVKEVENINGDIKQLKAANEKITELEITKNSERLFLKSQIMLSLENKGYEVMDDLEVIDFEKEKNFLLKIQGQENFLNLKFNEDGSMKYVFQIPKDKESLSTDEKKMKLHEMGVSCSDFQSVLKDLKSLGLNIPLNKEMAINEDALISLTKKQKEKLNIKSKKQSQQQLRKKYLN